MFPLSGGVVRFPHLAFGYVRELHRRLDHLGRGRARPRRSRSRRRCSTPPSTPRSPTAHTVNGETVHTLTALGYGTRGRPDGAVRGRQLLRRPLVRPDQQRAGLVEARHHPAGDRRRSCSPRSTARTSPATGFTPPGWHGVFTAIATSGIVFSYLGFRQGIELAGETDNPQAQRADRRGRLGADHRRDLRPAAGRLHRRARPGDLAQVGRLGQPAASPTTSARSPRSRRALGLGWLAVLLYVDAIVSPGDTGLIYTTITSRISYAMARNGNAPQTLAPHHRPRRPAGQPGPGLRRRADRVPAVPELAAAGRLHHLGDRAVLRVRPAGAGRAAPADARPASGRSGCPAGTSIPFLALLGART